MVIGGDEQGHERLAIGKGTTWTSYRALPENKWDAATRRGDGVDRDGRRSRLSRSQLATTAAVRPLARDGVRLVPLTGPRRASG